MLQSLSLAGLQQF